MYKPIEIRLKVYDEEGVPKCVVQIQENESKQKHVAMLLYQMKKIEQEFIDREWDDVGFEIEED